MARKKVILSLVAKKRERDAAYKKRTKTMKKGVGDITTLCGIEACLIVYPNNTDSQVQPDVWPSGDNQVQEVIARFRNMIVHEQQKNMLNHESQLQKMVQKAWVQLEKKRCENKRTRTSLSMFNCLKTREVPDGFSLEDANALGEMIDNTLMEIEKQREKVKRDEKEAHKNQASVIADLGASGSKGKEPMMDDDDDGLKILLSYFEKQNNEI